MTKKRNQDTQLPSDRIQRTYSMNNSWYFELRGGGQKGPYDSEDDMHSALEEFIQLHQEVSEKD